MSRNWLVKLLVLHSRGRFKTNFNKQYNICKSGNLVDQWSNYCTITLIKVKSTYTIRFLERLPSQLSKLVMRYIAILLFVAEPFESLVKLLDSVFLPCGSFKIDISTRIISVKVIVSKISYQTVAL